ncbi:MAG TPA: type II CAAX endopeptidase family protein [Halococcus sp.]|nr:type II CAAX endopeptidase family protein [Halococcus sp.]
MPRWAVFAGVTAVVLGLLLALARVSQLSMSDGADATQRDSPDGRFGDGYTVESNSEPPLIEDEPAADTDSTPEPSASQPASLSTGVLLANVALSQGLFLFLLVGSAWYARIPPVALGVTAVTESGLSALVIGVSLGIALYLVNELGTLGANAVGIETPDELRASLAPDSTAGWLVLLGLVLPTIAVFEEFLFRAALVGAFSMGFSLSPWLLALFSSVAFALGHGAQGTIGMVATGGLGFVLAGAFVLTGSLLVVVVAHYLVNALEFAVHEGFGSELAG